MPKTTTVLMLSAEAPDEEGLGGVQLHTAALARHAPPNLRVLGAHPAGGDLWVEQLRPERRTLAVLPLGEGEDALLAEALETLIVAEPIDVLHVHSPAVGAPAIARAVTRTAVPCVVTLHDHSLVCENYPLLEQGQRYCGIPTDLSRCDRCLSATRGRKPGAVRRHRARMQALVEAATVILAPSGSVLEHASRVFPDITGRARRIEWGVVPPDARCRPDDSLPLRAAIVGVQTGVKGSRGLPDLLLACRDLPVEWHLFGATEGLNTRPLLAANDRVVVHGSYSRPRLYRALARARIDLAVLPSIVPESFSMTLSEVVAAGLPVVASRLGALEERVNQGGLGWLFDPHAPAELAGILEGICRDRSELLAIARDLRSRPVRSEAEMAADHARLYEPLARARVRRDTNPDVARSRLEMARQRVPRRANSRWMRALRRIRNTDWYRDMKLRRIMTAEARKRVEHALTRWSTQKR